MSINLFFMLVCGLLSYMSFNNAALFHKLKHWPFAEVRDKEYYRLLSSGFIHGSWIHLLVNMFVLYMFGGAVESKFIAVFGPVMGAINYSILFIVTIVLADIPSMIKHKNNPSYAAVGASGAVSGIVFTYILFEPWQLLYLYAIIPIPGIIAGILYLLYSSWASKNSQDNIDHDAHFYGAVTGMCIAILLHPQFLWNFLEKLMHIPYFN
jgi:membrane associated rhomboid family serine protease